MISEITNQIRSKIGNFQPQIALILGSGLGSIGNEIQDPIIISYGDIKGFPQSSVSGHQGRLIIGKLKGVEVLCMQGRIHIYEGHSPQSINTIIKVFQELGIKELIVTNAAGSLDINMPAGSIMLISDHINLSGTNPLIGANDEKYGPRFPAMGNAYDIETRNIVKKIAQQNNIKLFEGVYLMVTGPTFDTAAEIKAFHILGADAVGMSTVPEVICAVHSGMKVLGFSVITNLGTGLRIGENSHTETLEQANLAGKNLAKIIKSYLEDKR